MIYAFIVLAVLNVGYVLIDCIRGKKLNRRLNRLANELDETSERIIQLRYTVGLNVDDKAENDLEKGRPVYYQLHLSANGRKFLTRCKRY